MKILWLVNIVMPELAEHLGRNPSVFGGWLTGAMDAVRQQDPRAAEKLVDVHLGRWVENERKLRKQYPEYFLEEVNEK